MFFIQTLLNNPIGLLFLIIAAGLLLGALPLGKTRLGPSGILIAGLVSGHYGYFLPVHIQSLGVVLFVYAVGLKAGPRIWESFKQSKGYFLLTAAFITACAGALALLLRLFLPFPADLTGGLFAGAMTSTPALAAVMETARTSAPIVGYGVAYPLGTVAVILAVQILPALFRVDLKKEEENYRARFRQVMIDRKCFKVTNPNVAGIPLADSLRGASGRFRIVRIQRQDRVFTPHSGDTLELGDIVMAVGVAEEIETLKILLGETTGQSVPESEEAHSKWLTVTSRHFIGKQPGSLEISSLYGVIITRVRRSNIEFVPKSNFVFEAGDEIRASGASADLDRFARVVGQDRESVHETDMFSLAAVLVLGVAFGLIKVPVTDTLSLSLGLAGGPLLAGLFLGHLGRFGKLTGRMPKAAINLMGDLGLYFFLAVAGCYAGEHFVSVIRSQGLLLVLCSIMLTLFPIFTAALLGRLVLKMNMLVLLGMICGGMTSSAALGALTSHTKSDVPVLAYAGIYPIAIVFTTFAAQWLTALKF